MSGGSDRRLYARFTLDFADSPKIAPLSDRAFREYVELVLWSRRIMTDGRISKRMIPKLLSESSLEELTTNGDTPSLVWDGDDLLIHDFAEHQTTREQIEQYSAAGRKAARARYEAKTSSTSDDAKRLRIVSESQSESNSQTETETETRTTSARKRGSRISETFAVDDALRAYAQEHAPAASVDREREQFVNYWLAASGKNAVKIDWRRAFMSWLNNAQRYAEERGWQPSAKGKTSNEAQQRQIEWLTSKNVTLEEWEQRKSDPEWVAQLRGESS